ncbi:MAG: cytochrome P450 [Alphaproteobacteria bacterium]|nr:cytochrome P450 [Alphaproteobacteria bacterium]
MPGGRRFLFAYGADANRFVLGHPDLFRSGGQVLVGPKDSAHYRLRRGIFAMNGDTHRAQRRAMQPPFLKPVVATYAPIMAQLIDDVLDQWRVGDTLDIYREMRKLSNWVAAYILFGSEDFHESVRMGETIERWLLLDTQARSSLMWADLPGTSYGRLLRQAEVLETAIKNAIARIRRGKMDGTDALTELIRSHDSGTTDMSETDMVAHAVILYAASFETTANALAWTLYLVAQHTELAAELCREVHTQLVDWPPEAEEIERLSLMEGVVKESLRLFPPVAHTLRTADGDAELAGLNLAGGDKVILCHYLTHRDPDVFPEPNRFRPARWRATRTDHYEYAAFSAGPRICLGMSFALLELKLTLARILQRFRFRVVPGAAIEGTIQLTLRPKSTIPMQILPLHDEFAASPVVGNIHRMVDTT